MTEEIIDRGGGPIPLVSDSAIDAKGQLMVYNHWGGCKDQRRIIVLDYA